jgi:hypothetical protein
MTPNDDIQIMPDLYKIALAEYVDELKIMPQKISSPIYALIKRANENKLDPNHMKMLCAISCDMLESIAMDIYFALAGPEIDNEEELRSVYFSQLNNIFTARLQIIKLQGKWPKQKDSK